MYWVLTGKMSNSLSSISSMFFVQNWTTWPKGKSLSVLVNAFANNSLLLVDFLTLLLDRLLSFPAFCDKPYISYPPAVLLGTCVGRACYVLGDIAFATIVPIRCWVSSISVISSSETCRSSWITWKFFFRFYEKNLIRTLRLMNFGWNYEFKERLYMKHEQLRFILTHFQWI